MDFDQVTVNGVNSNTRFVPVREQELSELKPGFVPVHGQELSELKSRFRK